MSKEFSAIQKKHPTKIPIICHRASSETPELDKNKFLIELDLSFSNLIQAIRRRIKLSPTRSLFLFINNIIIPPTEAMSSVYAKHKSDDGFLYVVYAIENTFGYHHTSYI